MVSDQRIPIDVSLVRELMRAQFPRWADLPLRRVDIDGWDNSTFRLGNSMKVRLPTHGCYAPQVAKEYEWLPRIKSHLPVSIPTPLALGVPTDIYPWPWAIYSWITGDPVTAERIWDQRQFAADLARFLLALEGIDAVDGPAAGAHSFYRGGSLSVYNEETRRNLALLDGVIDVRQAESVWDAALSSTWNDRPVWVHGDFAANNLIIENDRLVGVIDFGCCTIGDPACDLTIAWTLLSGASRETFRTIISMDDRTWARARGWALWKALVALANPSASSLEQELARGIITTVITEHMNPTH